MYTDPATGNLILIMSQLLVCFVIFAPFYGFGRYAVLSIRHNANHDLPKPRFPWWAALLWVLLCAFFIYVSPYVK